MVGATATARADPVHEPAPADLVRGKPRSMGWTSSNVAIIAVMVDRTNVYEPILGLRRGGSAVVLLTYRGDW